MTRLRDISEQEIKAILTAGVLAPSADNHHLFWFSISENRIVMRVADAYRAANAQTQLLAWISYGAVVENMQVQASAFGRALEATWFPDDDVICDIHITERGGPSDSLASAIPLRHTNRRFFSGPPLDAAEQIDLQNQLSSAGAVKVMWLDSPRARRRALRLMRLAETERFRSRSLHAELFSGLRFDVGYKASCAQGIPIGAAEIELPMRPLFRMLSHWPVMRVMTLIGTHRLIGLRAAYFPARLSPHIGLVSAEGDIRTAAIQTGRGFERLWLRASQLGLALQPLAAGPLYARPEFEGISKKVRAELRAGWAELASGGIALMVFRLGHARPPSVRAGRPPSRRFSRRLERLLLRAERVTGQPAMSEKQTQILEVPVILPR